MVITRGQQQRLFVQEAQRLSLIDYEISQFSEPETRLFIHRPVFSSTMEEQFMRTLAKEQIKSLARFGGSPTENVNKWLKDIEIVFDRAQLQPSNKYIAVQSYLSDAAEKWFRLNKASISD